MTEQRQIKDSGVEWIGEIPEGWNTSKISTRYSLRSEKVSDKDWAPLSVTMKGILPQLATAAKTDDGDNRKLVRKGDFAINSRSDRRGSCGISAYDGSVSLINIVLSPRKDISPKFYDWLFHTPQFADEFYKWGHGIVDDLWTTRWSEMKRISIPVPPPSEQRLIASYLDRQCSAIDDIVASARASIEDYKQLKASTIYEAVTKGLNPDVEMKDSGVEWIGMMPKSWDHIRLKYIADLDSPCDKAGLTADSVVSFAPMECIRCDSREPRTALFSKDNGTYSSFSNGDIALAKVTPCFENGNIAVMDNLENGYCFGSSELFSIRPRNTGRRFLFYALQSDTFIQGGRAIMTGTGGLKRVSAYYIKNASILLPTLSEQRAIASYLDTRCAQIDELIAEKEALIADLEAYKKSLIFECVTGKRRVVEEDITQ